MEFTIKITSKAEDRSTQYIEILHRTFEIIIDDYKMNGYELSALSQYARQLCSWMDDEASKRKDL